MNTQTPPIFMNPQAHFMTPGSVAFIPGWIMLFLTILTLAILYPRFFKKDIKPKMPAVINLYLLSFIIGSLMPVFDDLFAFLFGQPFAHHSLFHSFAGAALTYFIFLLIANPAIAKYALLGNLYHIFFNFYLDYTTLFFPFTYQEFGLTDIIKISTYWIKAIHYPIIIILFIYSLIKFFLPYKRKGH